MKDHSPQLEEKISDWLSSEGYRLEYLCHGAFKDAELNTTMSHHVESPDGKMREIDVTAMQDTDVGTDTISIRVLCECKYSKDKPWILMQSGLSSHLFADWHALPKSKPLRDISIDINEYEKELNACWHFLGGNYFAHNLMQAFRVKNRDSAFDSLKKISNAAWDCVETPERRGFEAFVVAIPSIVVEAPLFVSWFDREANKFMVRKVSYGRLSWSGCRGGTVVDVIHASALQDYAKAIKISFETILRVLHRIHENTR